jgi:hypothetical protein
MLIASTGISTMHSCVASRRGERQRSQTSASV